METIHRNLPSSALMVLGMARYTNRFTVISAIAVCLVLVGCALPPPGESPPPMPEPTDDAIRMAAVGDSITDGDSLDLAGGTPGPQSWVSYAIGPEVEFVGGWAEWGATSERMAEAVQEPFDADVLVILGGTNDAGRLAPSEVGDNLVLIAERAATGSVVLSSVPPNDFGGANSAELNAHLEQLAAQQGWTWVDSAAGLRSDEGDSFADDMSYDGVHPTEEGARVIGEAIGDAVIEAVSASGQSLAVKLALTPPLAPWAAAVAAPE